MNAISALLFSNLGTEYIQGLMLCQPPELPCLIKDLVLSRRHCVFSDALELASFALCITQLASVSSSNYWDITYRANLAQSLRLPLRTSITCFSVRSDRFFTLDRFSRIAPSASSFMDSDTSVR